jgi:hypothetical protein
VPQRVQLARHAAPRGDGRLLRGVEHRQAGRGRPRLAVGHRGQHALQELAHRAGRGRVRRRVRRRGRRARRARHRVARRPCVGLRCVAQRRTRERAQHGALHAQGARHHLQLLAGQPRRGSERGAQRPGRHPHQLGELARVHLARLGRRVEQRDERRGAVVARRGGPNAAWGGGREACGLRARDGRR